MEEWHAFDSVAAGAAGVAAPGDATITVPDLADGRYQLWWWCDDGSGPGGGIHYSTGPRLAIGQVPDTATADPTADPIIAGSLDRSGATWVLATGLGVVTFLWFQHRPMGSGRSRTPR